MEASWVQNGIQLLLATEQEAQQIVNTARNTKMARLKQAKEKTEKEVALRFQVEADFERKVPGVYEFKFSMHENGSGDYGANVKWLEHETEEKSHYLKTQAA
ncbi:V-type proton ATPase subunit G [Citrus sinensis]|nr:V-type proton ATPase subunit G [Citrus sinensis]